jgi:hypothetical protein
MKESTPWRPSTSEGKAGAIKLGISAMSGRASRWLGQAQLVRAYRSAFVRVDAVSRVERNGRDLMRLHTEDGAMVDVGAS